jgi:hypothetical protein
MKATLGVDRRKSPLLHTLMGALPMAPPAKKKATKPKPPKSKAAVPSSHASNVALPAWQALPPATSVALFAGEGMGLDGRPRLWTPEEDAALRDAVALHKGRNWKQVALHVPGRTSVQCLQRWKHVLVSRKSYGP